MRFVARTVRGLYVQAAAGTVFYVPQDGTPGYPVAYLSIEARSQRERAAAFKADGNRLMARRLIKAAKALESLLRSEPVAA